MFSFKTYSDYKELKSIKTSLVAIQGLAVDYLSRFILSGDKIKSFDIPLLGAAKVDEAYESNEAIKNALMLLDGITGLNQQSIINVCKIVCYDSAYRAGLKYYRSPNDVLLEENLFDNVLILVERTLMLLKNVGKITADGFTFKGGYTELVSSGDGDYLTTDTLIELKTSSYSFSTKWSLQLLMYYILGIHSTNPVFLSIKKLCIVNPYLNQYCVCNISDISDKSKYIVSNEVLGYKMIHQALFNYNHASNNYAYSKWKDVDGSDKRVIRQFLNHNTINTDFDVNKYDNGIFEITVDDYFTFAKKHVEFMFRPIFRNTKYVKLLKHDNYFMFISVSPKGKYSLLHGARLHALSYSLEYYYDKMKKYAETVTMRFSKYWDALKIISQQVKSLRPDKKSLRVKYSKYLEECKLKGIPKKEQQSFNTWCDICDYNLIGCNPTGYIHGCIVDIDFYNHIYLNPYDGSITPYYAFSMDDKDVFENVQSLLSVKRPDLLESSSKLIDNKSGSSDIMMINDTISTSLVSKYDIISNKTVKEYSRDMYTISNRIKPLKDINDIGWIQVWYDDILNENKMMIEDKYKNKKTLFDKKRIINADKYLNKDYVQKDNMIVTIISYRSYNDVDVRFEDGYILKNVKIDRVKRGTLVHPVLAHQMKLERQKKNEQLKKKAFNYNTVSNKYVGMTIKMNCGLNATCIDYKNCNNLTVRFEDGLIRTGIRSDHFINGKVAHSITN